MAQYLSEKLGQEEFLKICADYGSCLDAVEISIDNEITATSIREVIEQAIYKGIKEEGIWYFENLPLSFQEKHPELFLPKEIDEEIRIRFGMGELSFDDIRKNPQIKDLLLTKDISVGFGHAKYKKEWSQSPKERTVRPIWKKLTEQEIMDLAEEYGEYLNDVDSDIFIEGQSIEERKIAVQNNIEENILNRMSCYDETAPEFFKQKHPEMFLDEDAPDLLKRGFYEYGYINFEIINDFPESRKYLEGKDLRRAFPPRYEELFKRFDSRTLMKLASRSPEIIEKMVLNNKEDVLKNWYKSTGGKFVPHHVVMLNFPEDEIDSFLSNSKKWSKLMKLDRYTENDEGKLSILKAAYSMGVFHGDDNGFRKTMDMFTELPKILTEEQKQEVIENELFEGLYVWEYRPFLTTSEFENTYRKNENGEYILKLDKKKDKEAYYRMRGLLEDAEFSNILTPEKAHQIFDSFAMEYNPDFAKFFNENLNEILSNPECTKNIAMIQREFKDISSVYAAKKITLEMAQAYIKNIEYTNIDVGNERVAEQAKIASYSQEDFEAIQMLYNEGELREFSSIPRIQGKINGYTYEMLRCDDPLALTIGTLTDCCQEIYGAGQTSMEHSVVSPDGRVFCIKDAEGRIVAQSWVWRNQYIGCFDNIEIPNKIFDLYEKKYPNIGRKKLATEVLEVYKKAAQDLMQEDARVYQELLENGTITKEQYDALLLGKVTIGLGYNDIADTIKADKTIYPEFDIVEAKTTDRLPYLYTDAYTQYAIVKREGIVKSKYENLYVHQDDVPVFDETNISNTILLTMKRMEEAARSDNLTYLDEDVDEEIYEDIYEEQDEEIDKENLQESQKIINSIAKKYGLDPNITKVMATARIALIYSKDIDNKVTIGDLLYSPLKTGLTEEQRKKATEHIMYQIKKALKQIGVQDSEFDLSSLNEKQKHILQSAMQEIAKEKNQRGER